jgi:hypothetical protein
MVFLFSEETILRKTQPVIVRCGPRGEIFSPVRKKGGFLMIFLPVTLRSVPKCDFVKDFVLIG